MEGKEMKKDSFSDLDLAPLEQSFVGSSPFMDERRWDSSVFRNYFREMNHNADLLSKLLAPPHFVSKKRNFLQVNDAREQKQRLKRALVVFDVEQQMELAKQMTEPYLELSPVDSTGRISGEWKVGLENGAGNEVPWDERLGIEKEFQNYFFLEKDPNSQGMILKITKD